MYEINVWNMCVGFYCVESEFPNEFGLLLYCTYLHKRESDVILGEKHLGR